MNLQQQINVLKAQIAYLEARLSAIETAFAGGASEHPEPPEEHPHQHVHVRSNRGRTKKVQTETYEDPYAYPSPTSII